MTALVWKEWPLMEDCYKAPGRTCAWVLHVSDENGWVLCQLPHHPTIVPALIEAGTYANIDEAKHAAQMMEEEINGSDVN